MSDVWYYVENDAQAGPISYEQLRKVLLSAGDSRTTLVWRDGLSNWKPAIEVDELASLFGVPPPLPRRMIQSEAIRVTRPAPMPPVKESGGKKALGTAAAIVGALIGIFAVKVLGASLLWPAGLIGLAWFVLAKCKVESAAVPMLAFVIGHTGWMVVGYAALYAMGTLRGDQMWNLADVVIVTALSIWFLSAKSRAAAIGVLVYQISALGFGVMQMGDVSIPGLSSQGMAVAQAVHIVLRLIGIGFCVYAVARLGKIRSAAKPAEV